MKRPPRWLAATDGIAHAHPSGRPGNTTPCGAPVIRERDAWPIRARCPACVALTDPRRDAQ